MRILGGLNLDGENWDFSFVSLHRRKFMPYAGICGESSRPYSSLKEFITDNMDGIDERISYIEKKHSFKTESIFFRLPKEYAGRREVENTISLNVSSKNKKITYKDINIAKKQVENISLGLKDICLHHLVFEYKIGEKTFNKAPIGFWARKIYLKSLMIFIPSSLYDVFMDSFTNVNRKFSGFVYGALADYSAAHNSIVDKLSFVVNIKKSKTNFSCFHKGKIVFDKTYDFGNESIISYVADRLSFNEELASDLVFKYSSFSGADSFKEISVRGQNTYINVSLSTLNNLVKEAMVDKIAIVISDINKKSLPDDYTILFIGKLTQREGFYDFVRNYFSINVERPLYDESFPCASGCVYYGVNRFFEKEGRRDSLWHKVVRFYQDYF